MSDKLTIRTNNQPRHILYWHDLTDEERAEFDYLDTAEHQQDARFVRYRGWVYDLSEFSAVGPMMSLDCWDGYVSDSFYSGVVCRYVGNDCEAVIMGTFFGE